MVIWLQRGEKRTPITRLPPLIGGLRFRKIGFIWNRPLRIFFIIVQGGFPNADLEETELLTPNFGYLAAERRKRTPITRFPPSIGGL